jgi:hypothetical protein
MLSGNNMFLFIGCIGVNQEMFDLLSFFWKSLVVAVYRQFIRYSRQTSIAGHTGNFVHLAFFDSIHQRGLPDKWSRHGYKIRIIVFQYFFHVGNSAHAAHQQ